MGRNALRWVLATLILAGLAPSPAPGRTALSGTEMHVDTMWIASSFTTKPTLQWADVRIVDEFGAAVDGATVTGDWSGCFKMAGASAVTQTWFVNGQFWRDGFARVPGKKHSCSTSGCTKVFTVTGVAKPGMSYNPGANVLTTVSQPCLH